MKKIIWLIALLPFFTQAQTLKGSVEVQLPKDLVTESRLRFVVDSLIRVIGKGDPVVVLPGCDRGPEIKTITKISSTGASVLFDGQNVTHLSIEVRGSSNARVYFSEFKPSENVIPLTFTSALPAGTYTMYIRGINCSGADIRTFVVANKSTGEDTTPPVITDPTRTVRIPITYSYGLPEHVEMKWDCNTTGCKVSDVSAVTPPAGFSFLYLMNGEPVRQKTPVTNYQYDSPIPLAVRKFQIRDTEPILYPAGSGNISILNMFSNNNSIALSTTMFR